MRALDLLDDTLAVPLRERRLTSPPRRLLELTRRNGRNLVVELFPLLIIFERRDVGVSVDEARSDDGSEVFEGDHLGAVRTRRDDGDERGSGVRGVGAEGREKRRVVEGLEGVGDVGEGNGRSGVEAEDELEGVLQADVGKDGTATTVSGTDGDGGRLEDTEEGLCVRVRR